MRSAFLHMFCPAAKQSNYQLQEVCSATIHTGDSAEIEEAAIALATADSTAQETSLKILTNSELACIHYIDGKIGMWAAKIRDIPKRMLIQLLVRLPRHTKIEGNCREDKVVQGYAQNHAISNEATDSHSSPAPLTYTDLLGYCRETWNDIQNRTNSIKKRGQHGDKSERMPI